MKKSSLYNTETNASMLDAEKRGGGHIDQYSALLPYKMPDRDIK
jgi:hypothetical protein